MLKSVSKNAVRCWNIVILLALCLLLNCTMAQAAATLVTDKIQWEAMVSEIEVFVTTADKIVLADEAYYLPGLDEQLGSTLTFQTSNTGMSRGFVIEALETGAGLTFDDDGATEFEDALSVGDIDAYEDDDWQLSLLDGASMMAFGVEIRHSDFAPGEAITLYSGANAVGTVDLSLLPATGNNNYFIGIISDVPFDRIVFNEDPDGDDIAIADFRFAAQVVFTTDLTLWEAMVSDKELFTTTSGNIALANEVPSLTGLNDYLGPTLTFQTANTGLSRGFEVKTLQSGAGFTFNDTEGGVPVAAFQNALSVGDIDDYEDDDWQLRLLDGASMTAFGVEIRDSNFTPGEAIRLYSGTDQVGTVDLSSLPDTGGNYFIGIVSDVPFDRIVFDEDSDGDDIAIADFRFAIVTSCPLSVRIAGTTPVYYSSLQAAYDNADGGETIQSHDAVFTEDIAFDLDKSVFFEGGYDCDYTSVTGKTTVYGNMSVSNGMVTIQNGMLEAQ